MATTPNEGSLTKKELIGVISAVILVVSLVFTVFNNCPACNHKCDSQCEESEK